MIKQHKLNEEQMKCLKDISNKGDIEKVEISSSMFEFLRSNKLITENLDQYGWVFSYSLSSKGLLALNLGFFE